jgi:hypothetical protein
MYARSTALLCAAAMSALAMPALAQASPALPLMAQGATPPLDPQPPLVDPQPASPAARPAPAPESRPAPPPIVAEPIAPQAVTPTAAEFVPAVAPAAPPAATAAVSPPSSAPAPVSSPPMVAAEAPQAPPLLAPEIVEQDDRPLWRERPENLPEGQTPRIDYVEGTGSPYAADRGPHWDRSGPGPYAPPHPTPNARFAYSAEQRAAWLDECRASQLPAERRSGGLIGGLLGGFAGGLVGNRVADGSRLVGTVVGGIGGAVAGAVIGSAIERSGDRRREERAIDFCEDYLNRYELGATSQPGHGYPMAYVPVMMQPVPAPARRVREEVIEEWVEVPPLRTARRTIPARPAAPAADKRIPVK